MTQMTTSLKKLRAKSRSEPWKRGRLRSGVGVGDLLLRMMRREYGDVRLSSVHNACMQKGRALTWFAKRPEVLLNDFTHSQCT